MSVRMPPPATGTDDVSSVPASMADIMPPKDVPIIPIELSGHRYQQCHHRQSHREFRLSIPVEVCPEAFPSKTVKFGSAAHGQDCIDEPRRGMKRYGQNRRRNPQCHHHSGQTRVSPRISMSGGGQSSPKARGNIQNTLFQGFGPWDTQSMAMTALPRLASSPANGIIVSTRFKV